MDLEERVRELSFSIPSSITNRLNFEWISKIPFEGSVSNLVPNNLKIRYLSRLYDLEEMQRRSEVWQPLVALASICGAYIFGLNLSRFNPFAQMAGCLGSAGFIVYNAYSVLDFPYRVLSHHDKGQRLRSIPRLQRLHNIFRSIGDYDEKPFPASTLIEAAYKRFIEKGFGEERLFSFLDFVLDYTKSVQSYVKNSYWCTLPKYSHLFPI